MSLLLEYHKAILADFLPVFENPPLDAYDGLLIMAKGLGLRQIICSLLKVHDDPTNFVLLINTPAREAESLKNELLSEGANLKIVNAEINATDRSNLYLSGGIIAVTSRVLIVDMLNDKLPIHMITGIMVNHSHKVNDLTTESFILRLFRQHNKEGFIRAFSDSPEAYTSGIWRLEKTMKSLMLRRVFLWPRYHTLVQEELESTTVNVIELQVPMTPKMRAIMNGIVECMDACLAELRRTNIIDIEDLSVENALFKSFDAIIRQQLDPIWHKVSLKTKQLVGDLKTLRTLLSYLTSYDAVTFYSFLETIQSASAIGSTSVFKAESVSPWLLMDAAQSVFTAARDRVYKKITNESGNASTRTAAIHNAINFEPVLEEQPKWIVLMDILAEIEAERMNDNNSEISKNSAVLIMVDGDRECSQIKEIIANTPIPSRPLVRDHINKQNPSSSTSKSSNAYISPRRRRSSQNQSHNISDRKPPLKEKEMEVMGQSSSTQGGKKTMLRLLQSYFKWKNGLGQVQNAGSVNEQNNSSNTMVLGQSTSKQIHDRPRNAAPASKRRRVRGGASSSSNRSDGISNENEWITLEPATLEITDQLQDDHQKPPSLLDEDDSSLLDIYNLEQHYSLLAPQSLVIVRPYSASSGSSCGDGEDDSRVLNELRPRWIIMYAPDMGFVRRIETYQINHPGIPVHLYFMVYENSVEQQKYLSSIKRENESFSKIIKEKATMVIPIDQDGRTQTDHNEVFWKTINSRIAGGAHTGVVEPRQVIVDVREFRSSLPSILHSRHLVIKPCTLEVADYILSPRICVERKTISDLVQSFRTGRLYTQCESMMVHYKIPILLIEFDQNKAFSLQASSDLKDDISFQDISSKLILLSIHFPKLRIIWSSSPYATSEIFEDLKKLEDEPDMERAMSIGVESLEEIDSSYALTPQDIIRALPGITSKNYKYIMQKMTSIEELTKVDLKDLEQIIGIEPSKKLWEFMRKNVKD